MPTPQRPGPSTDTRAHLRRAVEAAPDADVRGRGDGGRAGAPPTPRVPGRGAAPRARLRRAVEAAPDFVVGGRPCLDLANTCEPRGGPGHGRPVARPGDPRHPPRPGG